VASFYVQNFGCRATQADGAAIERQFRDRGLQRAPHPSQAEIVVLNTCTVTASADQDARAAIRRIHRENPACQIVVTGCYAQRAPEELAALPGVSGVIGNSHKHKLVDIVVPASAPSSTSSGAAHFVPLTSLVSETAYQIYVSDIFAHTQLLAAPIFDAANERTRPNLKVQDGCDNRCSFCVIPYVRGHSRSLPLSQILREVNALVESGYREVVISGINLGRWGRDLAWHSRRDVWGRPPRSPKGTSHPSSFRFEDLVAAILAETTLEKLRISSVEPMDWSNELIRLIAKSPRIAKHAHVPMQSGSDSVLRRMHRKYRPWHYREKIEKIRAAMPTAAIGADVMVGFPGETDTEFEETRRMIEDLPFTYLHVFTYSARPGTPAAMMPNQVPVRVACARNRILHELAAEKKVEFQKSFIGRTLEAITLTVFNGEYTEALTDNYLKLQLKGQYDPNHWIAALVEQVESGVLIGLEKPLH
jgi:threonylcarbamoyladenosine tRNA methylthiotransferase MtaB